MKNLSELKKEFKEKVLSSDDDFWLFEPTKVKWLKQLSLKIFLISGGKSHLSHEIQKKLASSLWKTLDICYGETLPFAFLRKDYLFLSWLIEKNIIHLIWLLAALNSSYLQDEEWKFEWLSKLKFKISGLPERIRTSLVDNDFKYRTTCVLSLLKDAYFTCARALGKENFKLEGLKNFERSIEEIQEKSSLKVYKKWPKIMEKYKQFYSEFPWLIALAAWGSVGHGNVDSFSTDIDIYGFTNEKPTQEFMEEAVRTLGNHSPNNRVERGLAYSIIDGVETHIDFVHLQEIPFIIAKLAGKKAAKPLWRRCVALDELQNTAICYDPTGWLKNQKQKLLEVTIATQNLRFEKLKRGYKDNLTKLEHALSTKSLLYFQETLTSACNDIIEAMFILNNRHCSLPDWWKWITSLVRKLNLKPEAALERLLNIYCNLSGWTLQERYRELKVLAEEVFAIQC